MVSIRYKKFKEQENTLVTTRSSVSLPPELLLKIFRYLLQSQKTLYTISLVCKQWSRCVVPVLYSHPRINDTYRWATFILTLTRDKMSCFYGDLIRAIDLSSGKSIGKMKRTKKRLMYFSKLLNIEAMKDNEFYKRLTDASHSTSRTVMIRSRRYQQTVEQEPDFTTKGLPFIIVTTSSLIQLANNCKNLTYLNLSYTSLLHDSRIVETGEYVSTLQHYAIQPGLTQIQVPIQEAIEILGRECQHLTQVIIQRCEWVTAQIIWLFTYYCPQIMRLDARRSTKCTVKRLIMGVLEAYPPTAMELSQEENDHDDEIDNNSNDYINTNDVYEDHTNSTIHFVINGKKRKKDKENVINFYLELTGLYEQIAIPRNTSHLFTEMNATLPTWAFIEEDDGGSLITKESLKDMVCHIILEARQLGALDLNWIDDYQ